MPCLSSSSSSGGSPTTELTLGTSSFPYEGTISPMEYLHRMAAQSSVVVFSHSSCCMCHVAKHLLSSLGVNPTVYELDKEGAAGYQLQRVLLALIGDDSNGHRPQAVPAIFIGGKLLGGLDHVMAAHISGALVPLLKQAGALWL